MNATVTPLDTITFQEIAAELRVDASTVRRAARRGALQTIRIGRQERVPRTAYEAFIANGGEISREGSD